MMGSLNMFPNKLTPDLRSDLDYDTVEPRGPGEGEGPYGSYNDDDEGVGVTGPLERNRERDLSLSRNGPHPPKYATAMSELFSVSLVQDILDQAYMRARRKMATVLTLAMKQSLTCERFAKTSYEKADDLLETALYREIMSRGDSGYDLKTLTPIGVVEFLDYFMSQNNGRVAQLQTNLNDAFYNYWSARYQIA